METHTPQEQKNIDKEPFKVSQELLFCFLIILGWAVELLDHTCSDAAGSITYLLLMFFVSYWFLKIIEKKILSRWMDIIFFIIVPFIIIGSYSYPEYIIGNRYYAFYILLLGIISKYWILEDKFFNKKKEKTEQ